MVWSLSDYKHITTFLLLAVKGYVDNLLKYTEKQKRKAASIHQPYTSFSHSHRNTNINISTAICHNFSSQSLLSREQGLSSRSSRLAVGTEARDGIQTGMHVCVFGFVPCTLYFPLLVLSGIIFNVLHPSACHSVATVLVCFEFLCFLLSVAELCVSLCVIVSVHVAVCVCAKVNGHRQMM